MQEGQWDTVRIGDFVEMDTKVRREVEGKLERHYWIAQIYKLYQDKEVCILVLGPITWHHLVLACIPCCATSSICSTMMKRSGRML